MGKDKITFITNAKIILLIQRERSFLYGKHGKYGSKIAILS